jgi:hypothetical protein
MSGSYLAAGSGQKMLMEQGHAGCRFAAVLCRTIGAARLECRPHSIRNQTGTKKSQQLMKRVLGT